MLSGKKKKTTKGRQKVELKQIENKDARYITFSKRRNGVFSKASEISTLCGAEVLVLIYSPGGKPHTFGSPDVNMIADRFFSGGVVHPIGSASEQANEKAQMRDLNEQLMELNQRIDALKARRNEILKHTTTMVEGLYLNEDEDGMSLDKLTELNTKLDGFQKQAKDRLDNLMGQGYPPPRTTHEGGSLSYDLGNHPMPMLNHYIVSRGQIQQESLNHHSTHSVNNSFQPVPSLSSSSISLNPTRVSASLEPSSLFRSNWANQNQTANKNPFDPEFYQSKPSS